MAKIDITKTELVWPGKYDEDGTLKEVPRVNLPFSGHRVQPRQEHGAQADCLAGHVLIPNEAAQCIVWSGGDPEGICDEYCVSRPMLEYRLNTSGARKRRARWQRT